VRLYNALRSPGKRAARAAVGLGLATGALRPFLRDRVVVRATGASDANGSPGGLIGHLREVLARPDALFSVGVRTPGPNRKPVLEALSPRGDPLGFVKVGWNDVTRAMVATEADVLSLWERRDPPGLGIPRLIGSSRWMDLELSFTAPLPLGVRRHTSVDHAPHLSLTREVAALHGISRRPFAASPYLAGLRRRVEAAGPALPEASAKTLTGLLDGLASRYGSLEVTFGTWHGDWSPWNFARAGDRLYVLDWEHARPAVPYGLDVVHFHYQVAFILRRMGLAAALALTRERGLPLLERLGVESGAFPLYLDVHLLEVFLRANEAMRAGGGTIGRFYEPALAELERRARNVEDPAAPVC
jgi:hypothetical protein